MPAVAMQANMKQSERMTTFDTDTQWIGVDNRCSGCISHIKSDFVGKMQPTTRTIKGFAGSRTVNVSIGTLRWEWEDNNGTAHTFLIPNSYYVPDGKVRLLSPQHWAQTQTSNRKKREECGERTNGNGCELFWGEGYTKRIKLGSDNVATFPMAPGFKQFAIFCQEAGIDAMSDDTIAMPAGIISDSEEDEEEEELSRNTRMQRPNPWVPSKTKEKTANEPESTTFDINGSESTKTTQLPEALPNIIPDEESRQPINEMSQLLTLHHQYGHIPMRKLQEMAKQGILPRRLANCNIPTCSACLFARATRRPWRGKIRRDTDNNETPTAVGEVVSVDQLESPTPGLIAQMTGKLTTKRYKYATVYVDQRSRLGFVHLQKTSSAEETIEGKKAFETYARRHRITIKNYLADNGIFKANLWVDECKRQGQGLTFAGVNAHHQNGVAERRIRELQDMARTMLIHANSRWPESVTTNLWPYAIRMASEAINNTPSFQDEDRKTPVELFANSNVTANPKHWKPFGCPVYVLDNQLQSGKPFHKWQQRSKVGIYLGKSPQHGRSVALVLSRETGLVSPQFHVAFDPTFRTVKDIRSSSQWQLKAGFIMQPDMIKDRPDGNDDTRRDGSITNTRSNSKGAPTTNKRKRKSQEIIDEGGRGDPETREQQRAPAAAGVTNDGTPKLKRASGSTTEQVDRHSTQRRRSSRKANSSPDMLKAMMAELVENTQANVPGEIFAHQAMFPDQEHDHIDPFLAYKAVSDPDTLYYHQAMREPDRSEFESGMEKEINDQFENGNFTVIRRSEVPDGCTILPAVWQMRRKRDARTGKIKKYKARLNIDGSRMKYGEHYNETYAPVASWNSVRMLLTMTSVHGWHTKQIDFVQAFAQAPVEKTLYMKIPAGVKIEGDGDTKDYVLKIHRNIYGQKQAGRVWNKYLSRKLTKELGFKQSKVDECVYYRGKTLYVLYTDDSLLAGPDKDEIRQIIEELQTKSKLSITVEGDLADFLGVSIERKEDGTIHMTQPHLIEQILGDLRMLDESVKPRSTPAASSKVLTRHSQSPNFDGSFNYRSVIGKLNYLEKATRSDISFAVHQCARFVSDPKKEHGEAVRWLARYLKGTKDKGTILKPMAGKDLEVFVDASFCGDWCPEEAAKDRDTARSRHGYVILYAGCPLLWKSQLQTEIALSSTESEYTGLSYALRDAIPIMELLKEMKQMDYPVESSQAQVHCRVFEDNSGALEMAKVHKYRPRTKHLNVRLHHFRDYVERQEISIHSINTNDQPADFLTKALNEETLKRHRLKVMGW